MKKLLAIFSILLFLFPSIIYATSSLTLSVPSKISTVYPTNITWIFSRDDAGILNCTFNADSVAQTVITNNTIGCEVNSSAGTGCEDYTWYYVMTPNDYAKSGCSKSLVVTCISGNATEGTFVEIDREDNASTTFCYWDYDASDLANIGTDIIGETGVQTKNYVPLWVTLFIVVILLGSVYVAWKKMK